MLQARYFLYGNKLQEHQKRYRNVVPNHGEDKVQLDQKDYVEKLLLSCELTDDEWSIIQGYFYDERTLKEIGNNMGITESRVSVKKKELLDRIRFRSKLLL